MEKATLPSAIPAQYIAMGNENRVLTHAAFCLQQNSYQKIQDKTSREEVKDCAVAAGAFPKYSDKAWPGYACQSPCRQYPAVNGAELTGAEQVGKICGHAGKTAPIAGYDQEYQRLKYQCLIRFSQQAESQNLYEEKDRIG